MRKHIYLLVGCMAVIIMAIWHIELTTVPRYGWDAVFFTNGFLNFNGWQVYHMAMYSLLIAVFVLCVESIYLNAKLQGVKK